MSPLRLAFAGGGGDGEGAVLLVFLLGFGVGVGEVCVVEVFGGGVGGLSVFVFGEVDGVEIADVVGGSGFFFDDLGENAVIQMFVELLGGLEGDGAGGAFAGREGVAGVGIGGGVGGAGAGEFGACEAGLLLAAVRRGLFDVVDGHEMAFEDIGAVEGFFHGGAGAGTEAANHGAFIVGEGVALAVVFAGEAFLGVFAGRDWTLLGTSELVGKLMGTVILRQHPC